MWTYFIGQIVSEMNFFCQNKFQNIKVSHIYFFWNFFTSNFFTNIISTTINFPQFVFEKYFRKIFLQFCFLWTIFGIFFAKFICAQIYVFWILFRKFVFFIKFSQKLIYKFVFYKIFGSILSMNVFPQKFNKFSK